MNVPLQDILQIYSEALYRVHLGHALMPEAQFLEFMHLATERIEFSFDNVMYAQIHGVSMGSP